MQTGGTLLNPNPTIYAVSEIKRENESSQFDEETYDKFDSLEIFEILRRINDPEHPVVTLEQLNVIKHEQIYVDNENDETLYILCNHLKYNTRMSLILPRKIVNYVPNY